MCKAMYYKAEWVCSLSVSRGIHLCDLELFWGCTSRFPPVLVRVMYKSRLRFFGKPDGRIDIPYQVRRLLQAHPILQKTLSILACILHVILERAYISKTVLYIDLKYVHVLNYLNNKN